MIALVKDVVALVALVPELVPLLRALVKVLASAGTKDEKITRARRAIVAAAGREALFEALPGDR